MYIYTIKRIYDRHQRTIPLLISIFEVFDDYFIKTTHSRKSLLHVTFSSRYDIAPLFKFSNDRVQQHSRGDFFHIRCRFTAISKT